MLIEKIKEKIAKDIKPYLKGHGGDIEIVSLDRGILTVKLTGCCSGCPSAMLSTREFILKEMAKSFPEIVDVCIDRQISNDMLDFAKKILQHEVDL